MLIQLILMFKLASALVMDAGKPIEMLSAAQTLLQVLMPAEAHCRVGMKLALVLF
jgi:hypothetical protein